MGLRSREDSLRLARTYVKSKRLALSTDFSNMEIDQIVEKHWNVLVKMDSLGDRRYGFVNRSALREAILSLKAD